MTHASVTERVDWPPFSCVPDYAFGVVAGPGGESPRVALRLRDLVVDLAELSRRTTRTTLRASGPALAQGSLNAFMALGRGSCSEVLSEAVAAVDAGEAEPRPVEQVRTLLPVEIGDFVDFYASRHHAQRAGQLMRPGSELPEAWPYVPLGYHSRASSVGLSGEDIVRPSGQFLPEGASVPVFAPTRKLDFELELGFVVGTPSDGTPVPPGRAAEHLFGAVVLNDWSARDIQRYEARPLGPMLGKAFATSISAWVVPWEVLATRRVPLAPQRPVALAHLLGDQAPMVFDIPVAAAIRTREMERPQVVCRTSARHVSWSIEQQVAHLTSGGARLRTGDLLGTGTISGPDPAEAGSLLELSSDGGRPLTLDDGSIRGYLQDRDELILMAEGMGLVRNHVVPSSSRVGEGER